MSESHWKLSAPVPTFALPCCPLCSHRLRESITSPIWKYAHNTSAKRQRNCYFFMGCEHTHAICDPKRIYDGPAEWAVVEAAWKEHGEKLFAQRTATWSEPLRETFRRHLAESGKMFLPGATESLPLPLT